MSKSSNEEQLNFYILPCKMVKEFSFSYCYGSQWQGQWNECAKDFVNSFTMQINSKFLKYSINYTHIQPQVSLLLALF